jgi:signal transduction histidine kinase
MTKKILIVDDKPDNLVALEMILRNFDAEIITSNSGNDALTKTIEYDFAVALIDVQMPEMDGFEMVKILRQVEKTKYLPVIFISAIYSEDQYLIQGIEAGAVDFIIKPFQPRILLGKVKVFLDLYEQKKRLEVEIQERIKTESNLIAARLSLIEAKKKAEESDKLKSAFLANMSHEIRTPLTTIVGFVGLLAEDSISNEAKQEYIGYVYKSSENLLAIINDILDVAKIEAGQLNIEKNPVDINNLLNEIHQTFKTKIELADKNIELQLQLPEGAPLILKTDEGRVRQILQNLLGNALKFTSEGVIQYGYTEQPDFIQFFVHDTGIGMPEDQVALIFDRFKKLENGHALNSAGTGLGLSIVKKLVEFLGGTISVSSKLNSGSLFSFTIPNDKDVIISKQDVSLDSIPQTQNLNWSSKSIMVVEDEFSTFVLLESLLSPTGVKLQWAKNGQEAIDNISENTDAVLMDINMPVMSGIEAFQELRKVNKKIPVIAQTAYAMADEKDHLTALGFNGYITKPIFRTDLFNALKSFL